MSQSALSASIRALERELNAELFTRTTRRVELTDAGRALLDKARLILTTLSTARAAVSSATGRLSGVLRIGAVQAARAVDQGTALARFRDRHPDVEIHYSAGTSPLLLDGIRDGELDVAIVSVPPSSVPGVTVRTLVELPATVLCVPDDPLTAHAAVEVEMLADRTFVAWPQHSYGNGLVERIMRRNGQTGRLPIQVNDLGTMLEFVAQGLGIAILPAHVAAERPPLVSVPINDPDLVWSIGAATPTRGVAPAAEAFLDLLAVPGALAERAT